LTEAVGAELATGFRGRLVVPGDRDYDDARQVYNAMIDRRPALVARCVDVADVIEAISFAREHELLIAVRGGGHNGAGLGTCDGGIVLDLSPMKGVLPDVESWTVRVQGGATWGDVDHATHPFGLAVPSGIISSTGVGGLTLGGGIGHLTRCYGLTIDNLLAAELVLADGSFVKASADEHPDLFWAIRGGGGNFGVVTAFEFALRPVDTVVAGPTLWPIEATAEAMRFYRGFMADAPDELNGFFAFLTVPPVAPFPAELWQRKMCGVFWCHVGDDRSAAELLAPARTFGPPAFDGVQATPYPALQSQFDALYPPGLQWYWRADFFRELTDDAIAGHAEHGSRLPTLHSSMHLYLIDGAAGRVAPDETAFSHRDARWVEVIVGVDPDPAQSSAIKQWTVDYWEDLHPYSAGGAYVNFLMDEGHERVRDTYRDNYGRLADVKRRYDPDNMFRVNQNIRPAT
jgi:FAD/FMN-containing dehydrogenase